MERRKNFVIFFKRSYTILHSKIYIGSVKKRKAFSSFSLRRSESDRLVKVYLML